MNIIKKAFKLGYIHYTDYTVEELDKLPLTDFNKLIEFNFIKKWLREEHKISIKIDDFYTNSRIRYDYNVCKLGSQDDNSEGVFVTYEEALEEALQKALNMI